MLCDVDVVLFVLYMLMLCVSDVNVECVCDVCVFDGDDDCVRGDGDVCVCEGDDDWWKEEGW